MKTKFTKAYIMLRRGCYDEEEVKELSFINNKPITINDILKSEISLKDKGWWVINKCNLTLDQKKGLALKLAEIVLPIYQEKYPEDTRVKDCIKAIKDFKKGKITRDELWTAKRAAAYAAAAAYAYAAAYAAYAAYAAADAYAYAAADAAAYAAADAAKYQKKILNALKSIFKNN